MSWVLIDVNGWLKVPGWFVEGWFTEVPITEAWTEI